MWMLALGDYTKHLKRNLFISLQISILLFVVIIMMATLHEELYLYEPIESFAGKQGVIYKNSGYHATDKKQLVKGLKKVEEVLTYGSVGFFNEEKDMYYSGAVYGDDIMERFQPEMGAGKWLSMDDTDVLSVVVSQNDVKWKVGDIILFHYMDAGQKEKSIKAKVCGVLAEGTTLFGRNLGQGEEYHHDYRDLYCTYRYAQEQSPLFIFSESQIKKYNIPVDYNSDYVVSYQEGITEREARQNKSQLLENGEASTYAVGNTEVESLSDFMGNSKKEIMRNLMMYLPVLLCIFFVTIISIINVCTLNTRENYRQNAVFYLLGLSWEKCSFFVVVQNVFTMTLAILFTVVYVNMVKVFKVNTLFYTELYGESMAVIALILILLFSISFMIPKRMQKKNQPAEILRQERV